MPSPSRLLINTTDIEAWPAALLRARSNADARRIALARHVLRDKRDGRYLAAVDGARIDLLVHAPGLRQRLEPVLRRLATAHLATLPHTLPLDRLQQRLQRLGLDAGYADRTGLTLVPEPGWLAFAGHDRYRRPLWLTDPAARRWRSMQAAAMRDGVRLDAISGYRSHDYQLGIFERKLARGQRVDEILRVNAAPGYSEHHAGRALDIGTPGEPPAEESFEATPAFAWLQAHAAGYGFSMSYPRGNPYGIVYEPWHWCYQDDACHRR